MGGQRLGQYDRENQVANVRAIDHAFASLPLHNLADAALTRARERGATHASFRLECVRTQSLHLKNAMVADTKTNTSIGVAVRVLKDGTWGFAAAIDLTPEVAAATAEEAVAIAELTASLNRHPVELASEPVHGGQEWISRYDVDPFDVPDAGKTALLADWSSRLLVSGVDRVDATLLQVKENKFYADSAGTTTIQQRVRVHPTLEATATANGVVDTMRTLAPPTARGYEYLTGPFWPWEQELAQLPEQLAEKLAAPTVEPGTYDVVIDPSNLWKTIHESIGHATELDRALGTEAALAGTTFATPDQLGTLRYGSEPMNVTGDRTIGHGLASIGFDDEGVRCQEFDIVRDGMFVGYQTDRATAGRFGFARSNGCAFAEGALNAPLQRMANVSLRPAEGGPSTDDLIDSVGSGIYIVGDKSWSIDMQRHNFQFTGQRVYRIENGKLAGQLREVAYQGSSIEFWRSLQAVGGPQTYVVGGAFACAKGQPGQAAPVSHGCPTALFRGVNILNTVKAAA